MLWHCMTCSIIIIFSAIPYFQIIRGRFHPFSSFSFFTLMKKFLFVLRNYGKESHRKGGMIFLKCVNTDGPTLIFINTFFTSYSALETFLFKCFHLITSFYFGGQGWEEVKVGEITL